MSVSSTFTDYGDISPRTAAYASKDLLERAIPLMVLEKFAQAKEIPQKSSKQIKFRRYNSLAPAITALTEGVTPTGSKLTNTDVYENLAQYGDFVELTDVIADMHEDPVLKETMDLCGEQAALTLETLRWGVITGGTNVFRAGGAAARTGIAAGYTLALQREATNALLRQNAKPITKIVTASPNYSTAPVAPSFVAVGHVDLETSIRKLTGFIPVEQYGNPGSAYEGEIGKVENVRYILTTVAAPFLGAGDTYNASTAPYKYSVVSSANKIDVYPIVIMGQNAWATVALRGKNSVTPMVLNPNTPRGGDPLGQRGTVGWKTYSCSKILNEAWMARVEVAVPESFA